MHISMTGQCSDSAVIVFAGSIQSSVVHKLDVCMN